VNLPDGLCAPAGRATTITAGNSTIIADPSKSKNCSKTIIGGIIENISKKSLLPVNKL
jgi:hypothetical protein